MKQKDLIQAEEFCQHYDIELSFISTLHQYGLIELHTITEKQYIPIQQLQQLEVLKRLHYDLSINMEGLDAVSNLLEKVKELQQELTGLKNKLRFYETSSL